MKLIAEFDGEYGRKGTIVLEDCECNLCHRKIRCIKIDASEGEYNAGAICQNCANDAFDGRVGP